MLNNVVLSCDSATQKTITSSKAAMNWQNMSTILSLECH